MGGGTLADDPLRAPQTAQDITAAYLAPLLEEFLRIPRVDIEDVRIRKLRQGTSGSRIYEIAVQTRGLAARVSLLLKLDRPGEVNETLFYQQLRQQVPIGTPHVLDARLLRDGRGWILMEELHGAKRGQQWTREDTRAVVDDMARFHAANWGRNGVLNDVPWLPRSDAADIAEQIRDLRSCLLSVERAGMTRVLPEVLSIQRLRLIESVLDHGADVLTPLLSPGLTLVHGDYWFHNVQLLPDGRRVLLDWQTVRVFSGIWELVYFLDLRHVVGKRSFREVTPETEEDVAGWYLESLRGCGVKLPDEAFREALTAARIWHPITHWLTRYGRVAKQANNSSAWHAARRVPALARLAASALASKGAIRHMNAVWERWDSTVKARF